MGVWVCAEQKKKRHQGEYGCSSDYQSVLTSVAILNKQRLLISCAVRQLTGRKEIRNAGFLIARNSFLGHRQCVRLHVSTSKTFLSSIA